MYQQIKIDRKKMPVCPLCKGTAEWTAGKVDESEQEYMCRKCRIHFTIFGMTREDQECIAEEAFM